MKKLFITFSAAMLLISASAFATGKIETTVSSKVMSTFQHDFSNAENVSWEKKDDIYFASFDVNKTHIEAAYNEQGELVGTSRQITSAELPEAVKLAISEKYKGYATAKNATEINYNGQTNYYINVGTENEKLKIKCSADGEISVDSRMKN